MLHSVFAVFIHLLTILMRHKHKCDIFFCFSNARSCLWSVSYQCTLENNKHTWMSTCTVVVCLCVYTVIKCKQLCVYFICFFLF